MGTPLSPQESIWIAVALMATVGLIAYVVTRLMPRARVSMASQQQPAPLAGTDGPYDNILNKAELLLTYAADNGIEVGDARAGKLLERAVVTARDWRTVLQRIHDRESESLVKRGID